MYGFGPYYDTVWGSVMYYSVPQSGELNFRYEKIMNLVAYEPSIINDLFDELPIERIYVVTTDYWPLFSVGKDVLENESVQKWEIEGGALTIYVFEDD